MELATKDTKKSVELAEQTFDRPFSEGLVHQVVTAYLAGARMGTKSTKTRSQVRGGGRKPWRQKGTGRARAGTIRSPLWRGGGHTFAFTPRDHSVKVNRKMYRAGISAILSELVRQDRLDVFEAFTVEQPRTKLVAEKIADYQGKVLIVTDELDDNLFLGSRNLMNVAVVDTAALDPVTLVSADRVIATVAAIKRIEEWLK